MFRPRRIPRAERASGAGSFGVFRVSPPWRKFPMIRPIAAWRSSAKRSAPRVPGLRPPLAYLAAVLFSALALVLTLVIESRIDLAVYPAFLVAVVSSAWFGGWGPGLLSTLLSALACNVFFLTPGPFFIASEQAGHIVEFVLCGTALTALTERLRKINREAVKEIVRRGAAEDSAHRLNAELEDRVRSRTRELETALSELNAFSY